MGKNNKKCEHDINSPKTSIILEDRFFGLQDYQRKGVCKVCGKLFCFVNIEGILHIVENTEGEN